MSCTCGHSHEAHNRGTWPICGGADCCGRWCCLIFCPCVGICWALGKWRETDCKCQMQFTPAEGEGWLSGYGAALKGWIDYRSEIGDSKKPPQATEGWADPNVHTPKEICTSCYHTCHKARAKCDVAYNYDLPFMQAYREPVSGGSNVRSAPANRQYFPAKSGTLNCNCIECACANCEQEKSLATTVRCPCRKCTCSEPHLKDCTC